MSDIQEPVWGFIDEGVVTNIAVIYDLQVVAELKQKHDEVLRLDELDPKPGRGWLWDTNNGFRPPKPFSSWVWEKDVWVAPVDKPEKENNEIFVPYEWDEQTLSWIVPEWWIDQQSELENQDKTEKNG